MRKSVFVLALSFLLGCEVPPVDTTDSAEPEAEATTVEAEAESTEEVAEPLKTFTVTLSGDGVQFTLSAFTDLNLPTEQQLVITPTTIPAGVTLSYSVTGKNFIGDNGVTQSGVSRVGGVNVASGGPWLIVTLYENGGPVDYFQLSTSGTYDTFVNR